ncbi:ankyrin repeat-containing domain protein [Echria macrotheca]|uniref:Ankyrin repeat-containing domain protein n=1 Tax=Echria macrotheca TaxID=438768 RepID=A0AAJ0EZU6_9PEZI|nr:ankyrin repeat-containing domain protein [Echria macrotheca]
MEFAAAVIGIGQVAALVTLETRKLCERWKDAPKAIYLLRDELDTAETFFSALRVGLGNLPPKLGDGSPTTAMLAELHVLLARSNTILVRLQRILDELLGSSGDALSSDVQSLAKRRKLLWLRRLEEVNKLREKLRRTTHDIGLFMTLLNVQFTARVSYDVDTIEESQSALINRLITTMHSSQRSVEKAVERAGFDIEENIDRMLIKSHAALSSQLQLQHTMSKAEGDWTAALQRTITNLRIPSSLCGPRCLCQCHSARFYGRWQFTGLERVLGSLKITYSGLGLTPRLPCSDARCKDHRQYSSVMVSYSLPTWLANAVYCLFVSRHHSPELLLRVHRVVATYELVYTIFGRIQFGDVEGVRAAIMSRPSAVHDIDADGRSAILYAIEAEADVQMLQTLLQAGANPFQESYSGVTAAQQALLKSITHGGKYRHLADLLPVSAVLEEDGFTELHRLLMGQLPIPLADALRKPLFRPQVNTKTIQGLTPLHIAAVQGTAAECLLLLAAGADVDPTNRWGATPLILACRAGQEKTALALLEAGASATHEVPGTLATPLGCVACTELQSPEVLIDTLLRHGANIEAGKGKTLTPLAMAAYKDRLATVQALMDRGADLNSFDRDGDTPLNNAVEGRANRAAEALLAAGADYRVINQFGWGVVHQIALYGNVQIMATFARVRLQRMPDPFHYQDKSGRTALDHLRARSDYSEVVTAFQALMESIDVAHEEDDDEEFYDAPEVLGNWKGN